MTHWHWIVLAIISLVLASPIFAANAEPIRVTPRGATTQPVAYHVMEWTVDLDRNYDNPFDPDQIAVDGIFTGPKGKKLKIPAFWFVECVREIKPDDSEHWVEKGSGQFRIRAAFPEPGEWQLVVASQDKEGTRSSPPLTFHIARSGDPGFVCRARDNTRYLQFDSGKPFFAVGLNLGWPGRRGSKEYEEWFTQLSGAGGNFARIWMCAPNRRNESLELGLGRYDQGACAYYDQLLKLAATHHVACMLTFNNHIQLLTSSPWGPGGWPSDLYNAANGGPATQPANFFDPGRARQLYKQRLRYIVGRYSAFTSVMAWELWNEQELTKVKIPTDWTREMAAYLHAIDPYKHLVTTSYAETGEAETWSLPEIDLVQRHLYGDEGSLRDTAGAYVDAEKHLDTFNKPGLLAELGISWRNPDTKFDEAGVGTNLHNGLWAGALSGAFGGGCSWWWDSYVTPKNLWRVYGGLARFAAAVDWPRRRFEPIEVRWPRLPATQPAGYSDVELSAAGTWGRAIEKPLTLNVEGSLSGALPGFLYGPSKPKMRVPTVLQVDLPGPSQMTVLVAEVSETSTLSIAVDGTPAGEFNFAAKPGSPRLVSTTQRADTHNWVGTFNEPCPVELSPGHHTITLDNIEGDWLLIASVTFTKCKSSLISDVRPVVLQDSAFGETLAWLQDVKSNWYSDSKGVVSRQYDGLTLFLPIPRSGKYRVDWWDTRSGQIVRSDSVATTDLQLQLRIPHFERDIALRATPVVP